MFFILYLLMKFLFIGFIIDSVNKINSFFSLFYMYKYFIGVFNLIFFFISGKCKYFIIKCQVDVFIDNRIYF